MTHHYVSVLLLALAARLEAQTDSVRAVISGRVIDLAETPIKEAEIVWQTDKRSVFTGADGTFRLSVPIRGVTVVLVRKPGYRGQALRMDLTGGSWSGDIRLIAGPYQLPDVEVSARYAKPAEYAETDKYDDFFRRQKLGMGTFISREQIERMNVFHTVELLRGIPGVFANISDPSNPLTADIRMARCSGEGNRLGKVAVYVDGRRLIEPGPWGERGYYGKNAHDLAYMLEQIAPTGIEMVEIFRGPSQIPGEFHWDGCAAIAIWTRWNPKSAQKTP